ncbi:MAG: peptide chain release factor aRF-1 [Candidatus Micrarchaeota archaeon]|nr:peptide chain release factor aRF-1 [Candidatus Micrarchaeota archaeon]MDE1846735.1 peptide chain release factor aRF-1 [Candidatus Micrarchaeota archaeon]
MSNEYSLLKEVKRLRSVRGSGTELISVYIPSGAQIAETSGKLREELSQSSNIKSSSTKKNVQAAIEKILGYLRLFRETPKNGLAVFCGNISKIPGREDIELFSIEPPLPLKVGMYRCDSDFMLEPIEDMIEAKETYALVVMDGREATIATLKGPQIKIVRRLNSMAHAKVRKGGQSAGRFERMREEAIEDFHSRIGSSVNDLYAQSGFKIKGLIIGGPGPAKEGFAKAGSLNYQIKVLGVFNTGYTDEYGLHELVEAAKEVLAEQEASKERAIIERFMHEVSRNGRAAYDYGPTREAVESRQAEIIVINKDVDVIEEFRKNSQEQSIIVYYKVEGKGVKVARWAEEITVSGAPNPRISDVVNRIRDAISNHTPWPPIEANTAYNELAQLCPIVTEQRDAIEELLKKAEEGGIQAEFVSGESSFGKQFLMGFSGVGAILRYK